MVARLIPVIAQTSSCFMCSLRQFWIVAGWSCVSLTSLRCLRAFFLMVSVLGVASITWCIAGFSLTTKYCQFDDSLKSRTSHYIGRNKKGATLESRARTKEISMANDQVKDAFGNLTTAVKCSVPGCGKDHPVPVPWEE